MAFPRGVMRPSESPKVPRPETKAAWRSDHFEAKTNLSEAIRAHWGSSVGAAARMPSFFNSPRMYRRSFSFTTSP